MSDRGAAARKPIGFWRRVVGILAIGYPVALLIVILGFRLIGERWWITTVGLYLPRVGFALPLPVLTSVLLLAGPRRLLISQAVAGLLLLFPLMGLRLSGAAASTPGAFHLRVLSYNIDSGEYGTDAILAQLRAADPDLILLQETLAGNGEPLKAGLPGYAFDARGQFILASRYPIEEVFVPPRILHNGELRSARFIRYRLATPAGSIQVYNVHPPSPRDALDELHGAGLRSEIASGRIFRTEAASQVIENSSLRVAQLQEIADDSRRSAYPVLIAGDTNLPHLSWALAHCFGDYQDGFTVAGSGFGYTFPAPKHPWMRIDRVFAGAGFRFLTFVVSEARASDHLAVMADLELSVKGS